MGLHNKLDYPTTYCPNLTCLTFPQARGSSASPRTPHSRGFWLQHPDDLHQQWVKTDTPDLGSTSQSSTGHSSTLRNNSIDDMSSSPLTWPRRSSLTGFGSRGVLLPTKDGEEEEAPENSRDPPATLPRLYKSQATWVS